MPSYRDSSDRFRTSPLLQAVRNGNVPVMEFLLERGADPNLAVEYEAAGKTVSQNPLVLALTEGHATLARRLLQAGARPVSPWIQVILDGDLARAAQLMEGGPLDDKAAPFHPLHAAIRCRQVELVRIILPQTRKLASDFWSPLSLAVKTGDRAIVRAVLEHIKPEETIREVAALGNVLMSDWHDEKVRECVAFVLEERKIKPPASLLVSAAYCWSHEKQHPVQFLLERGLDAEEVGEGGLTARQQALLAASANGRDEVVAMLRVGAPKQAFHGVQAAMTVFHIQWKGLPPETRQEVDRVLRSPTPRGLFPIGHPQVQFLNGSSRALRIFGTQPERFEVGWDGSQPWMRTGSCMLRGTIQSRQGEYRMNGELEFVPLASTPENRHKLKVSTTLAAREEHLEMIEIRDSRGEIVDKYGFVIGIHSAFREP